MLKIVCRKCGNVCYSSVAPEDHLHPYCPWCGADLRDAGEVVYVPYEPSRRDERHRT